MAPRIQRYFGWESGRERHKRHKMLIARNDAGFLRDLFFEQATKETLTAVCLPVQSCRFDFFLYYRSNKWNRINLPVWMRHGDTHGLSAIFENAYHRNLRIRRMLSCALCPNVDDLAPILECQSRWRQRVLR